MAVFVEMGRIGYREAWDLQKRLAAVRAENAIEDTLLLLEHDPVVTYGSAFSKDNLLLTKEQYAQRGIELVQTDRGGDVTYHGPGQLVIYPIFNIREHGSDLHKWLRDLEQCVIAVVAQFGIEGYRFPPNTGVWTRERKIAAIGIKVTRWVNVHGIALNCNNDLSPFGLIIPCGIKDYPVTSLSLETGKDISTTDAIHSVLTSFQQVFNTHFERKDRQTLMAEINGVQNGKTA